MVRQRLNWRQRHRRPHPLIYGNHFGAAGKHAGSQSTRTDFTELNMNTTSIGATLFQWFNCPSSEFRLIPPSFRSPMLLAQVIRTCISTPSLLLFSAETKAVGRVSTMTQTRSHASLPIALQNEGQILPAEYDRPQPVLGVHVHPTSETALEVGGEVARPQPKRCEGHPGRKRRR